MSSHNNLFLFFRKILKRISAYFYVDHLTKNYEKIVEKYQKVLRGFVIFDITDFFEEK
jgi:hypothetical protein